MINVLSTIVFYVIYTLTSYNNQVRVLSRSIISNDKRKRDEKKRIYENLKQ